MGRAMEDIRWDSVASLYDLYVTATFDVPFFLAEAKAAGGPVLELMSGTGRVSLPLVEAGVPLTCVDASGEMLRRLRQKLSAGGLEATVVQGDVRQLDLANTFDLAILPFHSFSELVDPSDQHAVLAAVHRHLRRGARFICTLHNPSVRRTSVDGQPRLVGKFPLEGEGSLLLWSASRFAGQDGVVEGVQVYQEYDARGVLRRQRMLDMRFALIGRDEFEQRAGGAGFRVAGLYGDYDRSPFEMDSSPYMIWILEA
jgi:SAM-dependent methyltransferase